MLGNLVSDKTKNKTSSFFEIRRPHYFYKDLILQKDILHELFILQSMIENHDLVYKKWGMKKIDPYGNQMAFNLYGPPGTGKTMIVEALCNHLNRPLIDINLSQLESRYVGETGKNIVNAFETAKKNEAVLFFDEADTVLSKRLSNVTQSADSSVNTARGVMLKQLEQHSGIVAFATNFECCYDPAFVRRILKHIHVPLPDFDCRLKLWQSKLPSDVPGRSLIDFDALAQNSDQLSGGDILVAVKNALFEAASSVDQKITTDILLSAVLSVQEAKKRIGKKMTEIKNEFV